MRIVSWFEKTYRIWAALDQLLKLLWGYDPLNNFFLQCCGIAQFPVSRRLVLAKRCQMSPLGKRRLCMFPLRASSLTWQIQMKSPRTQCRLRKCSRYLASTSLLRVCLSAADGYVLYRFDLLHTLALVKPWIKENLKLSKVIFHHHLPFISVIVAIFCLLDKKNYNLKTKRLPLGKPKY